jgi:hypothetical protein
VRCDGGVVQRRHRAPRGIDRRRLAGQQQRLHGELRRARRIAHRLQRVGCAREQTARALRLLGRHGIARVRDGSRRERSEAVAGLWRELQVPKCDQQRAVLDRELRQIGRQDLQKVGRQRDDVVDLPELDLGRDQLCACAACDLLIQDIGRGLGVGVGEHTDVQQRVDSHLTGR